MERILHNTQEELEFYNFKLTIKEQMLESATDDVREERKADVDQVRFEIRWINTRINDEKASLSNAQNNYDYEVNYDASVRSQQEFDASNEELINRRIEREHQYDEASAARTALEQQITTLEELKYTVTSEDILAAIDEKIVEF